MNDHVTQQYLDSLTLQPPGQRPQESMLNHSLVDQLKVNKLVQIKEVPNSHMGSILLCKDEREHHIRKKNITSMVQNQNLKQIHLNSEWKTR
jgi:hypothetical protein